MTDRDKISHLLRRFGLGAGKYEVDKYESLGVQGAVNKLIDFQNVDEQFTISQWSFAVQADKKLYTDPYQTSSWWSLRLLMTQRPFQEKLCIFWHDHFAVSGEKVFEGATMGSYLEILRTKGSGKFRDLLSGICQHAALVGYLDAGTSSKVHPNENFAREVLELFTLGIGKYTENDVREAARSFTGWALHYGGIGDETPYDKLAERAARQGMSMLNFCTVPALHDSGTKKILGKEGKFDGADVIKMLADHPDTAKHICTKLWEFFAYKNPSDAVINKLVAAWLRTDGMIGEVCKEIAKQPEFWGETCVKTMPKSPIDYTVGVFRALGIQELLGTLAAQTKGAYEPVSEDLRKAGTAIFYLLTQQGMSLLFPPNVGGWEWGNAWITANNTLIRINHANFIFWSDDTNRPFAVMLSQRLKLLNQDKSPQDIVKATAEVFDVQLTDDDLAILVAAATKRGAPNGLANKDSAASIFAEITKMMFAKPSFQLC